MNGWDNEGCSRGLGRLEDSFVVNNLFTYSICIFRGYRKIKTMNISRAYVGRCSIQSWKMDRSLYGIT